jgi:integrase
VPPKMLTHAAVEKLKPSPTRRRELRDAGAANLYLVIQKKSGRKAWAMRFSAPGGRSVKLTLGAWDASGEELEGEPVLGGPLTLTAARRLAATVNQERARGVDVAARHVAARRWRAAGPDAPTTFGAVARRFIEEHAMRNRSWRLGTARVLGLDYPRGGGEPAVIKDSLVDRWRGRPLAEVSADDVYGAVAEAVASGIPGLERRKDGRLDSRGRYVAKALAKLFSWATAHRLVAASPAAGTFKPPPAAARSRVLSLKEMRWLWQAAGELGWPFGTVVQLLMITGARLGEVSGMRWSELSEDAATWDLPAARCKNKRPHSFFLPPAARAIVLAVPRVQGRDLLFTTNGRNPVSGWSKTKRRLDKIVTEAARAEAGSGAAVVAWRIHDVRRSVATHIVDLGIAPPHVVEVLLAHVSGHRSGLGGVYVRALHVEERRRALEEWAARLAAAVADEPDKKVVALSPAGRRR